jgi:Fe-S cluster biogenesis protein NfuA
VFTECLPDTAPDKHSPDPRQLAQHLQGLIDQIQNQPNPAARALLHDCLHSLLAFYGEGLSRILHCVQSNVNDSAPTMERLLQDPTVSGLLLIHGLHPIPLETRLQKALDKVRPYLQSHGGSIELLSLEGEIARVRLHGTCKTCPSSAITLETAVRRAVEEACPDLIGFETVSAQTPADSTDQEMAHVPGNSR